MPSTPQQISAIKMNTFKSPEGTEGFYYVVIKVPASIDSLTTADTDADYKNQAVDRFIEHYIPGYYPFVINQPSASLVGTYQTQYDQFRQDLFDSLTAINYRTILGQLPKVIYSTQLDLMHQSGPAAYQGIAAYNASQNTGEISKATTIDLTTLPMIRGEFGAFMSVFNSQVLKFPGQLNLNLNFNFLQTGVENILQVIIGQLTDYMHLQKISGGYKKGDELTLEFGAENKIMSISYSLSGEIYRATEGFITNNKYNSFFKDPLTLAALANYGAIIESGNDSTQLNEQSSFIDFITNTFGEAGGDNPVNFNGPHTPDNALGPWNNIFANRESEDLVDINDIQRMEKIFTTFKSSAELRRIENFASDPQVRKMALQQEKAKRINAAIAVTDVIDKALKFEFPMAGLNDTKAGRVINQIINQFGIQELAKEAIICLTQGATVSLSRISSAVKQELMNTSAAPLYTAPRNPVNVLERPDLGDFKAYFNITGDPPLWKRILDIILGALANAAFEIISSIADMIKFNCDDLFQQDVGQMAAGEELIAAMQPQSQRTEIPAIDGGITDDFWAPPPGDHADHLSHVFIRAGFETITDGILYLNLVSTILNPSEICKLFNSPKDVPQDTLDRILNFNLEYPDAPEAMNTLSNLSAVSAFFFDSAAMVDTTSMCNEYLNSVRDRLEAGGQCQVCFDYGALDAMPAVNELALIIDGGLQIVAPEIDFTCPDSEYFLENPVITTVIPNLFYTLVESIQMYMGSSIEASRTAMLQPVVTNQVNNELSGAMAAAGVTMEEVDFNPEVLETIQDIFGKIGEVLGYMNDPALCPDLDLSSLPNVAQILDAINLILDPQDGILVQIAPEIEGAINEIKDNIGAIQANQGVAAGNTPYVQYRFNQEYKDRFRYAIDPIGFGQTTSTVYEGYPYQQTGHEVDATSPRLNERGYNIARASMSLSGDKSQGNYIRFNFDLDASGLSDSPGDPGSPEVAVYFPDYATSSPTQEYLKIQVTDNQTLYGDLGVTFAGEYNLTNPEYLDLTTVNPNPSYVTRNINPFISRLVDAIPPNASSAGTPTPVESTLTPGTVPEVSHPLDAAGILYPQAFLAGTQRMFNYILNKGAFNEYKLSRLNFFKDNANCNPGNIGDLTDADGIIDQMQQEMAASACDTDTTVQEKIKRVVRYGVINLLIQSYVVEFIVSNIIVFSAFNMEDLFNSKYGFKSFMIDGVTASLVAMINRLEPSATPPLFGSAEKTLSGIVQTYLLARLGRLETIGLVSTDGLINFDSEEDLRTAPLSDLVKFLVDERVNHVWSTGNRSTIKAINNIIDPTNSRPSLEDIYLDHVVGMYPKYSRPQQDPTNVAAAYDALLGFQWFPAFLYTADSSPPDFNPAYSVTYGEVFFSRSITYYNGTTSEDVTLPAYVLNRQHLNAAFAGLPQTSPLLDPSHTNFRKSWTLYYLLPSHRSPSPALGRYPNFDLDHPDSWVGLGTRPGGTLFGNTAPDANRQSAFYDFIALGAAPNLISASSTTTPTTMADILAAKSEELSIMKDPQFTLVLEQILNKDAIFTVANLFNLHLSRTYFSDVRGAFDTTKRAILNLLENINSTEAFPQPRRPSTVPALQAAQATDGKSNMDSLMREIMLKVLKETPIAILKGLVELIDPHIAISKLIKDITGQAFNTAATAIDVAVGTAVLPVPPAGMPPGTTLEDLGVTGNDVLGLAFCGLNILNQQASNAIPGIALPGGAVEDGPLIGPLMTMEGIDFKGTVAGMFMAPPSPFGILYLLLSLLENLDIPVDEDAPPELDMLGGPDSNSC
jgi:hypothetical protein